MRIINLLPKKRQEELHFETILRSLYVVVGVSVASFAAVFLAQWGTKLYLERQYNGVLQEVDQVKGQINKKENAEVQAKIKAINDMISDYKNLADASPKWSKVLKAFAPLPPEGVRVSSFSIDISKKLVQINGISPTREKVIELYNNIKADTDHFVNVDYPLENLIKETNVQFHFSFTAKDDLLK